MNVLRNPKLGIQISPRPPKILPFFKNRLKNKFFLGDCCENVRFKPQPLSSSAMSLTRNSRVFKLLINMIYISFSPIKTTRFLPIPPSNQLAAGLTATPTPPLLSREKILQAFVAEMNTLHSFSKEE